MRSLSFSILQFSQRPSKMGYQRRSMAVGLLTSAEQIRTAKKMVMVRRIGCPCNNLMRKIFLAKTLTAPDSVKAPVKAITQMICWMVVLPNHSLRRSPAEANPHKIIAKRPITAGQNISPVVIVAIRTPKNTPSIPIPTSLIPAKGGTTILNRNMKASEIAAQM